MSKSIEDSYPPEMHDEMKAYEELLNQAISNSSSEPIANYDENHGALLMTKLFEQTSNNIAMVVGDFNGDISSKKNYLEALRNCLEVKKVKAKFIILASEVKENSKAFEIIEKSKVSNPDVMVGYATKETKRIIQNSFGQSDELLHFAVFDNDKFRLEIAPEKYIAIGNFNNTERSSDLLKTFNEAFKTVRV